MSAEPIIRFWDKYKFLSNFYNSPVNYQGIAYRSVETAYQAAKSNDPEERKKIAAMTDGDAKRYGATIVPPDWKLHSLEIMKELLTEKFSGGLSNKNLAEKLLATGDAPLVEGNTWHDNFWGACICDKCKDKDKLNWLGVLLAEVRAELRK